jgi:hypothetical protein
LQSKLRVEQSTNIRMVRTRSGRGGEIQTPTMKDNGGVVRRGRGRPPSVRTVDNPVIPIEVPDNPMVSTTAAAPNNESAGWSHVVKLIQGINGW